MADSSGFVLVDQVEKDTILNNSYYANNLLNFNENFVLENNTSIQNQHLESSLVSEPSNAYDISSQLNFTNNKSNFHKEDFLPNLIEINGVNSATSEKVETKENIKSCFNEVTPEDKTQVTTLDETVLVENLNMSFSNDSNKDENLNNPTQTKNESHNEPVIDMPLLTEDILNSSPTNDSTNINAQETTEVFSNSHLQGNDSGENNATELLQAQTNTTTTCSTHNEKAINNVDEDDIISHRNNADENDIRATSTDTCCITNTGNKRVKFPEGDRIVSGYMDPPIPWRDASKCTTEIMLNAYMKSCQKHNAKPLPSLISQLKAIGDFMERNETLTLRNEHLDCRQCECLEEVLNRVQFRTIDLENTHLDDESAIIMFEMIEYYESCIRLNVFMNTCIESRGWQACSHLIRKSASLEQVDLGRTNISEHMVPFMLRAFKLSPSLTVLRLENCLLSGRPLATLVLALKVNTVLKQLYLGNNKLNPLDCMQLHSLLNFNRTLKLLDLRNNSCQDTGVEQLSRGIVEQSREQGGLETLVLWNNNISHHSMPCLANALVESKSLLGLNLGMNVALTNEGVHCLKDALVRNRSLLKLGLQSCRLTCEGAVAIAEFIAETKTLLRVDLRGNDIRTGGLMALTLSLKVNRSLLQLDLDKNPKKENKLKNFVGQQKQLLIDIANFIVRNNKLHTQEILRKSKEEEEKKNMDEKGEIKRNIENNNDVTKNDKTIEETKKDENEDDIKKNEPSLQNEDQSIDEASIIVDSVQNDVSNLTTDLVQETALNVECSNIDVVKSDLQNSAEVEEVTCKIAQQNLLRNKLSLDLIKDQESLQTSCAQLSPSQPQNIPSDQTSNELPFNSDHLLYLQTPPSPHPNDVIPLSPVVLSSGVGTLKSVGMSNIVISPTDMLVGNLGVAECGSSIDGGEDCGDESKNIEKNTSISGSKDSFDEIIELKSDKSSCSSKDEEEIMIEVNGDVKESNENLKGLGSDSSSWESLNSFTTNTSCPFIENSNKIEHNVQKNNVKKETKNTSNKQTCKKVVKKKKRFVVTPTTTHHHKHVTSNSRNYNHNDSKSNHKNSEFKVLHTHEHNVNNQHDNTDDTLKSETCNTNINAASNEKLVGNNEAFNG